ncbi:MAG: hypothetical protein FWD46_09300 [Cystobacterineae bacterium]|nr:hypothetical protein [Cystobacterineae bacterium]
MALFVGACHKGPTNEERLERATRQTNIDKSEFATLRCDDAPGALFKARDENRPEGERLKTYVDLYLSLENSKKRLDEAIARNSDLAYQEGAQTILNNQEACSRHLTDVRIELERFVRDLADTPTFQEIRGNNIAVVPRVDFGVLRRAIEAIEMDGKQDLLRSVDTAEQKLGPVNSRKPGNRPR